MGYIFFEYSVEDKDYARKLHDALVERGFEVWRDEAKLMPGDNWVDAVLDAVVNCSAAIVLVSSHSNSSRWVNREVQAALRRDKPLVPILLEGQIPVTMSNISIVVY